MELQMRWIVAGIVALAAAGSTLPSAAAQSAPNPDPRVGLRGGKLDTNGVVEPAAMATWNMRLLSNTAPPAPFLGKTNADLAFFGKYAIQGNYGGPLIWDISNPAHPVLAKTDLCPASQDDVSIFKNLLFISSESNTGRLDCGGQGTGRDSVSMERMRGVRIFDVSDLNNPKYIANVQTCRGSHTHTVVTDPRDNANVYIYVSGQAQVRPASELAGCSSASPDKDPNSARFRIEVIKVPLAHPEQAAIVNSPRIFNDLAAPPTHGEAATEIASLDSARRAGAFIARFGGQQFVLPPQFVKPQLDSVVKARGGTGAPTGADSAAFRAYLPTLVNILTGGGAGNSKPTGPDQCHDITVYPAIGLAGGACAGYGLLLDIRDPAHPVRVDAVSDSNFSYWHSATFNNDGTKLLFSDEWGGGGAPKCRATDKHEWGADALFTLEHGKMVFQSYYKMPAAQTSLENCVAHNGSLIPIPGRDVMVQAWYQGGVSVFDWTDAAHPKEIAFFDRGPVDSASFQMGGSWSAYWYNGVIVSSEIARGLDILELTPNPLLTQNELDAARTVHFDQLNVQDQPKFVWPPSFALARAYLDQLSRSNGLSSSRITAARTALTRAEQVSGPRRQAALAQLATQLDREGSGVTDRAKVGTLAAAVNDLANIQH
ncbi:MAG: LVIVD repeat-containing protein [Gemmatimonadales bacterium]